MDARRRQSINPPLIAAPLSPVILRVRGDFRYNILLSQGSLTGIVSCCCQLFRGELGEQG